MTPRSAEALARIRELRGDRSPRAARVRQVEARVAALDPDAPSEPSMPTTCPRTLATARFGAQLPTRPVGS